MLTKAAHQPAANSRQSTVRGSIRRMMAGRTFWTALDDSFASNRPEKVGTCPEHSSRPLSFPLRINRRSCWVESGYSRSYGVERNGFEELATYISGGKVTYRETREPADSSWAKGRSQVPRTITGPIPRLPFERTHNVQYDSSPCNTMFESLKGFYNLQNATDRYSGHDLSLRIQGSI